MKHLLSFSVFEKADPKKKISPDSNLKTPSDGSSKKTSQENSFFDFSSAGSYSFKNTIKNAPEGKYYDKYWEIFEKNLEDFKKKFPCLPKTKSGKGDFPQETKNHLYYAIFLILKNSREIKKELEIPSDSDFNKLLRISIYILNYVTGFGTRKQSNEDVQMKLLGGDSSFINSIKSGSQNLLLGKESSVGYNQMKLSSWNHLKKTQKIFSTKNIQSLGSLGKSNPAHFAVALVSSMEYIWDNYNRAKKIGDGETVITTEGKTCGYSLGSWAWDVAFCSYTFKFDDLTKKHCKCKFVDQINQEGPFSDDIVPEDPPIKTSRGKISIYYARDCKDTEARPVFKNPENFKKIGTSDVKKLQVIPNSHIKNYLPKIYHNLGTKMTNRSFLRNAYQIVEKDLSCIKI